MNNFHNFNTVLAALTANKGVVIDTHNGQRKERKATGIAALVKDDSVKPVLLSSYEYFSLNLLEVEEDGTVILSDESVGGVVNPAKFGGDLRKALMAYNEEQPKLVFSTGKLTDVHVFQYGEKGESFFDLKLDIVSSDFPIFIAQPEVKHTTSPRPSGDPLDDLCEARAFAQEPGLAEQLLEKSRSQRFENTAPQTPGYTDTAKPLAEVLLERNRGVQPKVTDDLGGNGAAVPVNEE